MIYGHMHLTGSTIWLLLFSEMVLMYDHSNIQSHSAIANLCSSFKLAWKDTPQFRLNDTMCCCALRPCNLPLPKVIILNESLVVRLHYIFHCWWLQHQTLLCRPVCHFIPCYSHMRWHPLNCYLVLR